jgi:Flp pilus assembly pilin Flp
LVTQVHQVHKEAQIMKNALLKKLARDERGLSTMEYAVLFVIIVVGALTLWTKLGDTLVQKVGDGTQHFESTLGTYNDKGKTP